MNWLLQLAPYKKAVAGFISPGVALFAADVVRDQALPTHVEWLAIFALCVTTAAGVAVSPKNSPKTVQLEKETDR
jgi:hypothetical protein